MENKATKDFIVKFNELSMENQRYVIAVQQALEFAQSFSTETGVKEESCTTVHS